MHNSGGQKLGLLSLGLKSVLHLIHIMVKKQMRDLISDMWCQGQVAKNIWRRSQGASVEDLVLGLQHSLEEFTKRK